jgi:2'-5' RNA ligase
MPKIQARIPEEMQRKVNPIREKWNPERAAGNPAHVTILYHDEAPDVAILEKRLRAAVLDLAPFVLVVGTPERFREPARGVFLRVSDPTDAISSIRQSVLRPPFVPRPGFGLHVTILHPAQGTRLEDAWHDIAGIPRPGAFDVSSLQLVGSSNDTMAELSVMA